MTFRVRVHPLADESLGVRSMATLIECGHTTLLCDAGVSLAPSRYGLPPHPSELRRLAEARRRILDVAARSQFVVISHYHKDHYTPPTKSLYEASGPRVFEKTYYGKTILAIDPAAGLTKNQVNRAKDILQRLHGRAVIKLLSDRDTVNMGSCKLIARIYSHGAGKLGKVLGIYIAAGDTIEAAYLPDIQGPVDRKAAEEIVRMRPRILIMGGPPTYLAASRRVKGEHISAGLRNTAYIVSALVSTGTRIYLSHHLLRDPAWDEVLEEYGVQRSSIQLYSDYYGREAELLEAYRRELYEYDPPPRNYRELLKGNMHLSPSELLSML